MLLPQSILIFFNRPSSTYRSSTSFSFFTTSQSICSRHQALFAFTTQLSCISLPARNSAINRRNNEIRPRVTANTSPRLLVVQRSCGSGDVDLDDHESDNVLLAAMDDESWKSYTDKLVETLHLPSISVPARHVHWLLSDKDSPIQPYLASCMVELDGVHPKIKIVRDCDRERRKRILLDSNLLTTIEAGIIKTFSPNEDVAECDPIEQSDSLLMLSRQFPGIPSLVLEQLVDNFDAKPGITECIHVPYQNQPISRILTKLLPPEINNTYDVNSGGIAGVNNYTQQSSSPPPTSYEQIGHIAHLNLRAIHVPYGRVIGRVLLDKHQPSIRTVVNKLGEVGGPYRTYAMDLLAGDDDYDVRVIEHGIALTFDLRKVYWCTRLEGERTYMMKHEFKPNQYIADAFCGVGALCIRAAMTLGCTIVANDLNPDAVMYCRESARRNGINVGDNDNDEGVFQVQCGDAREFIVNLGINVSADKGEDDCYDDDVNSLPNKKNTRSKLPDHLLLNFPLDSPSFLNAFRWWPSGTGEEEKSKSSLTRVHVYTFARGDDERTPSEVAIDMVADGLLPEGGYIMPCKFRGEYLNELGCNVQAREIRDAAPGKAVICVSFSVTNLLLRRMQGDYLSSHQEKSLRDRPLVTSKSSRNVKVYINRSDCSPPRSSISKI